MEKGKWTWIGDKLRELNLTGFAETAYKIDASLLEIYVENSTPQWRNKMKGCEKGWDRCTTKREKLFLLFMVMVDSTFCIACETDELCLKCRFGKVNGICISDESIFGTLSGKIGDIVDKEGEV